VINLLFFSRIYLLNVCFFAQIHYPQEGYSKVAKEKELRSLLNQAANQVGRGSESKFKSEPSGGPRNHQIADSS